MLKIWGRISSINVQKVVWCARELGLEFERIDAGGSFGIVDTPAYRALNPNGKVPTIEDGQLVLWESNAIVRYLAARHGLGTLCPEPLTARADADRWMDWALIELIPAMRDAFVHLVRTPAEKRDPQAVAASAKATEPLVAILDARLQGRDYLCGDRLTMADIPAGCAIHRWLGMPLERTPRPNVEAWCTRLRSRPAAAEVLTLPVT